MRFPVPALLTALLATLAWPTGATADEFDDDFGVKKPPPPAAPTPATPAAPSAPAPSAAPAAPAKPPAPTAPAGAAPSTTPSTAPAKPAAPAAGAASPYEVFDHEDDLLPPPGADDGRYRDDSVLPVQNTVDGLVGGVHVVDAGSGPARTFRIGLYGRFFRREGYLVDGAALRRSGAALSINVTPIEHLELGASFSGVATQSDAASPALVQSLGDTRLSAKGYASLLPWLTIGGDVGVLLLNGVGGIGFQGDATSVMLRGNASFDLRETAPKLPLVARTSLSYLFDNSRRLVESIEDDRYASLTDAAPREDEYRHRLSASERLQLGVNRVDTLGLSFGLEAPLELATYVTLSPIVEWSVAVPVNRQGFDCVVTNDPADGDSCLGREGFGARLSTLTLGLRGEPGIRGLALTFAVDVATSGRTVTRELAPNVPYDLWFGLSYAIDTRPPRPREIVKRVAIAREVEAPRGRIEAQVLDAETRAPVPHAIVRIEGSTTSALATDDNGKLVSYELAPNAYVLRISAADYKDATCQTSLFEGTERAEVTCLIEALPRLGLLEARVTGPEGEAIGNASIELRGPAMRTLRTDASGAVEASELPAGRYEAKVQADGYLMKTVSFEVAPKQASNLQLSLVALPKERLTELKEKNITIKRQVQFVANSAEIRPQSHALLAEVADVLLRNPELEVEVQGHTDDSGTAARNLALSQARADAVRTWLIEAGVEARRLTAVGYGRTRPIAPNITESMRARNRRVEFVIVKKNAAP